MLKTIEKSWPFVSLLLALTLLVASFSYPLLARPLGLGVMALGLLMAAVFAVGKHLRAYRSGDQTKISRAALGRKIAVDLPGLLLVMALSIPAGAQAGLRAGAWAGGQGWGTLAVVVTGLGAGMAAGMATGLLARWAWGRLSGAAPRPSRLPA